MFTMILMLSMSAQADEACDARSLSRTLRTAGPANAARTFSALVDCDADLARREAAYAFDDMNPNAEGYQALVEAIRIEATEPALTWIQGLESRYSSQAFLALGRACAESPRVQEFFLDRAEIMGDDFWDQRWYKGLNNCNVEPITTLLWNKLEEGINGDYTLYYGVLEAYARSVGAAAVPQIRSLIENTDDAEIQTNILATFIDAAQMGSEEGPDTEVMTASVAAIVSLSDHLQPSALRQARQILIALDAETESDELAGAFHAELAFESGGFMWGVVVMETATCRNGSIRQRAHTAMVLEPGNTWPDQFQERAEYTIEQAWVMDLADECRGTGEHDIFVSDGPLADTDSYTSWVEGVVQEHQSSEARRFSQEEQPRLNLRQN